MNRAEASRFTKEISARIVAKFPKVSAMPRDQRGIPLPANVSYKSKNGKPVFSQTDSAVEIDLFCSGKCSVTGTTFDTDDVWFITAPDLAFIPYLQLLEPPMCGEAKDFTLQVCPYFAIDDYERINDKQAKAMAPSLQTDKQANVGNVPAEFVALKVKGFHGEPTLQGLRYLPDRNYSKVEFWRHGARLRAFEDSDIHSLLQDGKDKGLEYTSRDQWPPWAEMSLDGSLEGSWPWETPGKKEFLLNYLQKIYTE